MSSEVDQQAGRNEATQESSILRMDPKEYVSILGLFIYTHYTNPVIPLIRRLIEVYINWAEHFLYERFYNSANCTKVIEMFIFFSVFEVSHTQAECVCLTSVLMSKQCKAPKLEQPQIHTFLQSIFANFVGALLRNYCKNSPQFPKCTFKLWTLYKMEL